MGKDAEPCCKACKAASTGEESSGDAPPQRARHDDVKIIVRTGNQVSEVLPTGPLVRVGRAQDNEVVLPSGMISRRQCELRFTDDGIIVLDKMSACGTVIGGRKIGGPTPLPEGASILVGDFELRVVRR